jgi:hopanoid biosynthesis associated protein HpnK
VIFTADDFGLHESVNQAVEAAHRHGVLTATSLMVAQPAAADAIRRARELPDLRVGLHLVLADGLAALPAATIPALVDPNGRFPDQMVRDGFRFFASRRIRRQLEAEIHAQFLAFARSGLVLDHLNAHKHFHLHPTLLGMMLRIGCDFGLAAVRLPREPLWLAGRGASRSGALAARLANAVLLRPWLALLERRLHGASIACNDQLFGLEASGRMDEAAVLEVLARLPPGVTEIYLHPATRSGAEVAVSMPGYRHRDELAALLSPRVRAALDAAAVGRGGFRDAIRFRQETAPGQSGY